jgi:hypothetical protein
VRTGNFWERISEKITAPDQETGNSSQLLAALMIDLW